MNTVRQYKLHLLGVKVDKKYLSIMKCVENFIEKGLITFHQAKHPTEGYWTDRKNNIQVGRTFNIDRQDCNLYFKMNYFYHPVLIKRFMLSEIEITEIFDYFFTIKFKIKVHFVGESNLFFDLLEK